MKTIFGKAVLGLALGAAALTAAAPAEAQRYHGGYYRHGDGGGAVVAGLAGLAIGAAIASDRPRYYDDGYYPAYYAYPRPYYYGYPRYRSYYAYPHYRGGYGYRGGYAHGGYRGGGYHHHR